MNSPTSAVLQAYATHGAALRRFIWRFARNAADVEDIAQEAFLRAYVVELTRPIEQPKSFLFRIAKHLALSGLDRRKRWCEEEFDVDALEDSSAEDEAIAMESAGEQLQAIANLTPGCRRVCELRLFEDLSHKEIASRLGIAVSTVEKHVIRAAEQLGRVAA